jgi:hypothetical protein
VSIVLVLSLVNCVVVLLPDFFLGWGGVRCRSVLDGE